MTLKTIHKQYDWIVVPMFASGVALVLSFAIWAIQGGAQ